MRIAFFFLLLGSLPWAPGARADESVGFEAQVENESLAEEAILLVHCLASRTGRNWELTGEARGQHWVRAREKQGHLEGTYKNGNRETLFSLAAGDSDRVCDSLEAPAPGISLTPPSFSESAGLGANQSQATVLEPARSHLWMWAGVGVLAAGAAVLLLRSGPASHSSIQMN